MTMPITRSLAIIAILVAGIALLPQESAAQSDEDGWMVQTDEQSGLQIHTKELTLYARAQPEPALKHQFLPDEFEQLPGNAAVYYLKALGFLEQNPARERIAQYQRQQAEKAEREGTDLFRVAPYSWLETPPNQLPLEEVKEYLQLTAFQPPLLAEAVRRRDFDMDRRFHESDDPVGYLLPEIQVMRELARNQSLRCRVAIAEGRIDDARNIIGQQFALARHLGQDDFLVSNLVGIAIVGVAWNDALYLLQHRDTPNLYWALARMPRPLVDNRRSLAVEHQFLFQQFKVLQEVDETPRPDGYWQEFIDRSLKQMGYLAGELNLPDVQRNPEAARAALVGYIAAAYPGARQYLIDRSGMTREQVDALPTAQVVFLAIVRFYEHWGDEVFKWMYVPTSQLAQHGATTAIETELKEMRAEAEQYGWIAVPTSLLLPALQGIMNAQARCDQSISLLMTVEAIRLYAAENDGRLPPSLEALPVPAAVDPFTGAPVEYQLLNDSAVLTGHPLPGLQYRLVLRIAK